MITAEEREFIDRGMSELALTHGSDFAEKWGAEQEAIIFETRNNFTAILNTEQGKWVLWWIISNCGVFSKDVDLGKREVGLDIINQILAANPETWYNMQLENAKNIVETLQSK